MSTYSVRIVVTQLKHGDWKALLTATCHQDQSTHRFTQYMAAPDDAAAAAYRCYLAWFRMNDKRDSQQMPLLTDDGYIELPF